jgi:hypothetical protein
MFGTLLLLPSLGNITWQVVVMVVVALTIARMIPVAIAGSQKYADWYAAKDPESIAEGRPVHHHLRPRLHRQADSAGTASEITSG